MNRAPAVAGKFYPGRAKELAETIESHLDRSQSPKPAFGALVPHAGYVYSGDVAGAVFSRIEIPPTVLILNPNHTGQGEPLAVWPDGKWATPLGQVPVDEELTRQLLRADKTLAPDRVAHLAEHSGEVMLPFLQVLRPDVRVVVMTVGVLRLVSLQDLGRQIASVLKSISPRPLILASSDMTHFESADAAKRRDSLAIEPMLKLDEAQLFRVVTGQRISMCGIAPATAMLAAVKELGATRGELVKYDNSATAGADPSNVVGYAGMIFT